MSSKLKGVLGESSIVLMYDGHTINIQKETDRFLYEKFKDLLKQNDNEVLVREFLDVKSRIESYTNKTFEVKDKRLYLKGDDKPLPENITKRLLELETAGEDFMPLIRFWKKLKQNPSQASIDQLYGFMVHNNIGLEESGNIVVEKGVKQKAGAPVGELVDCRTGLVDNSIGMEVSMKWEDVDDNPNQTCSRGLHVGAPEYVRQHYGNDILIKCLVNPKDVVSIPTDYNNTKMRVCRYVVAGYSDKSEHKPIYRFEDFLVTPPEESLSQMETQSKVEVKKETKKDPKVKTKKGKVKVGRNKLTTKYLKKFSEMTAKEVVELIKAEYGVVMTQSLKSKKAIVNAASKIASNHEELAEVVEPKFFILKELSPDANNLVKEDKKLLKGLVGTKFTLSKEKATVGDTYLYQSEVNGLTFHQQFLIFES